MAAPIGTAPQVIALSPLKRKGREIKAPHMAATVLEVKDLEMDIKQHAFERSQIFYMTGLFLYKTGCGTDGTIADVKVRIPGAIVQVGQGDHENDASHPNAASNIVDNWKEVALQQIVQKGITPKKRKLLKTKGVTEAHLKAIDANHNDLKFVASLINNDWAAGTLFRYTEIEVLANKTNKLPRRLNRGCDLPLERKIRPFMAELYTSLIRGEVDPFNATDQLVKKIQGHFQERIIDLKVKEAKCSDPIQLKKTQDLIFYHELELQGTIAPDYSLLSKGFTLPNSQEIDTGATLSSLKPLFT